MGLQEPLNFTSLGSCDGTKGFKLSNPRVNWPVAADCQFSQREPENKFWPRSTLVLNSNSNSRWELVAYQQSQVGTSCKPVKFKICILTAQIKIT